METLVGHLGKLQAIYKINQKVSFEIKNATVALKFQPK